MVDCDDVFMVLTSGPFPAGKPSDAAIEAHLALCAGCRQLAEALRPPEDLVPETVTPEESRSLPSYWGPRQAIEPRVLSAVLAEFEYGQDEEHRHLRHPVRIPMRRRAAVWIGILRFLGAVCVGISLAVLYHAAMGLLPNKADRPAVAIPADSR